MQDRKDPSETSSVEEEDFNEDDIELLELIDSANESSLSDETSQKPKEPVYDAEQLERRVKELEKELGNTKESFVRACFRIQQLEKKLADSEKNNSRDELQKSKLAEKALEESNRELQKKLKETEEHLARAIERNSQLEGELQFSNSTNFLSQDCSSDETFESVFCRRLELTQSEEVAGPSMPNPVPKDPIAFVDYFKTFRRHHSITQQDMIDYWNSKKSSPLSPNMMSCFDGKRLKPTQMDRLIPVFTEFLNEVSDKTIDLNTFKNRKWHQFGPDALEPLNRQFRADPYPSRTTIQSLAALLQVDPKRINSWFREKRRQLSVRTKNGPAHS